MKKLLLVLFFIQIAFISTAQWTQVGLDINGLNMNDILGSSVSISSDGQVIVVGAPGQSQGGQVRAYSLENNSWELKGQMIEGNGEAWDFIGTSIALNSEGSVLAFGARNYVRIYKFQGDQWVQIGENIVGEAIGDYFGYSVSLSSDGKIVAIGGRYNDGGTVDAGHVQIYEDMEGTWVQLGDDIDGESENDLSGTSVSLSSDGHKVAIGAMSNDGAFENSGHVRVFEFLDENWAQLGNDIDGESENDQSGGSIDLNSDGTILAIGAYSNDANGISSGHVRIYNYSDSNWEQMGQDIDGDFETDRFGSSVAISSNGTVVSIGASNSDANGNASGQVKVFQYQLEDWIQVDDNIDGEVDEGCSGSNVDISSDGSVVLIGAPCNDDNGEDSGQIRVYLNNFFLGVSENFNKDFVIAPNLANDFVLVTSARFEVDRCRIYDITGNLIKNLSVNEESESQMIDVSDLDSGIYILKIAEQMQKIVVE